MARAALIRAAIVALSAAGTLAGCGSNALNWENEVPPTYVVRGGDTLYGIAWRYDLDHRDLARWNRLGSGDFIRVGQNLALRPPARQRTPQNTAEPPPVPRRRDPPAPPQTGGQSRDTATADEVSPEWRWPTDGRVVAEFGTAQASRSGTLIAGELSDPVFAAAAGKVVYSGSGLIGYGKLIIVKHNETFLSAYGHNAELLVSEGETIKRGQRIARMGEGPGRKPRLHFEIRRAGKPVNPRQYLPAR